MSPGSGGWSSVDYREFGLEYTVACSSYCCWTSHLSPLLLIIITEKRCHYMQIPHPHLHFIKKFIIPQQIEVARLKQITTMSRAPGWHKELQSELTKNKTLNFNLWIFYFVKRMNARGSPWKMQHYLLYLKQGETQLLNLISIFTHFCTLFIKIKKISVEMFFRKGELGKEVKYSTVNHSSPPCLLLHDYLIKTGLNFSWGHLGNLPGEWKYNTEKINKGGEGNYCWSHTTLTYILLSCHCSWSLFFSCLVSIF